MSSTPPEDDEFDDLFSFSVANQSTATTTAASSGVVSASTSGSGSASTSGVVSASASISSNNNVISVASTTTSGSESYCNVSVPTSVASASASASNPSAGDSSVSITPPSEHNSSDNNNGSSDDDDDDDDIFGEFDLDTIKLRSANAALNTQNLNVSLNEEDFNGMDEGTREFLDFLDKDPTSDAAAAAAAAASANAASSTGKSNTPSRSSGSGRGGAVMDVDMDDILGESSSTAQVQVLNDAGDILAGLENDSSDEEDEEEGEGGQNNNNYNKQNNGDDNDNDGDTNDNGFVTVESNEEDDATSTVNTATTATVAVSTSGKGMNDKTNEEFLNMNVNTQKNTDSSNSNSNGNTTTSETQTQSKKVINHSFSNNKPTVVKLPTLPKPNKARRTSSSTSLQSKSILSAISTHDQEMNSNSNIILTESNEFMIDDFDDDNDEEKEEVVVEVVKEIVFDSLIDALQSTESTIDHIRPFIYNHKRVGVGGMNHKQQSQSSITSITQKDRPYLWSKVICSKVLTDVQSSSLIDSFMEWDEHEFDYESFVSKEKDYDLQDDRLVRLIIDEVDVLSKRIVESSLSFSSSGLAGEFQLDDSEGEEGDNIEEKKAKRDLCSLLVFYYRSTSNVGRKKANSFASILRSGSNKNKNNSEKQKESANGENKIDSTSGKEIVQEKDGNANEQKIEVQESDKKEVKDENNSHQKTSGTTAASRIEWKSLIGPIAATLLSADIPIQVASVMLSKIISTLPLISLTKHERLTAVKSLHQKLYFLVCYHLPLLVLHLDRYAPGWHWPRVIDVEEVTDESKTDTISATQKSRNLEAHGTIPITWFASLLAGEGTSETLEQTKLLSLWDILLTCDDQSLKFFLALAMLEKKSDSLMMLRGQDLIDELSAVMSLKPTSKIDEESFLGHQSNSMDSTSSNVDDKDFVLNWYQEAKMLQETTPLSVTSDLRKAEDLAVDYILMMRSKIAMEQMRARLEAEAEAHRKAVEEENTKKAEAKLHQYYKKRLVNFYERHCPEKKADAERILEVYKDRYLILDQKLTTKYGSGFLPLISVFNPKLQNQTNKLISNMGQGIENRKKNIVASRAKERAEKMDEDMMGPGAHQVAIKVSASEILPFVCGGDKSQKNGSYEPVKYYLVDSRPNETVKVQGAFPTSVRLSPEDLMDPDGIQERVDMFESLRGAVHICIMGEGFSAFPSLYDHPLSEPEKRLLENDESRTNMCALFFIKKGFPFISVLDGGFAAAHSWLARDCDYLTLTKVLVDYDEQSSLFADLERSHQAQKDYSNASNRRKTTLAVQKLIDNSMTRLTLLENRLEEFTDRPRGQAATAKQDKQDLSISTNATEVQAAATKKSMKMPPMRLFRSNKAAKSTNDTFKDASNNASSAPGKSDKPSLEEKEIGDKDENDGNAMKAGFNKAFIGLKNIRVSRPPKDINEQVKKNTEEESKTEIKETESGQNQSFRFGKMNFSKKKSMFARKAKQTSEDDDLEKEIEASLTKPAELTPSKKSENKPKKTSNPDTKKSNNSFTNPLKKMSMNKFSSISMRRNVRASSQSIMREEESLFFEEESLDGTEDLASIQTDNTEPTNT